MLFLWILIGSGLLYFFQKWVFRKFWDRGLSVSLRFESAAVTEGDLVVLKERSENRKWLPLPMFQYEYTLCRNFAAVTENDAKPIVLRRRLALPGRRAAGNRTVIESLPRGLYSIVNLKLTASDLFYSSKWQSEGVSPARLTVYPAKIPAEKLSLPFRQLLGAILTRRMAQEDPFQLRSIRPYEIYDSLRTVNWKASARTGELKVNQYEYSTDEAIFFLLDLGSGSEEDREELIRLASSLSRLFLRRGVSVAMSANGRSCISGGPLRVPAGSGSGQQRAVDEALARVKLRASVTAEFGDFLRREAPRVSGSALPVVLSADPTEEAAAACGALLRRQGGYYISVGGSSDAKQGSSGVRVLSWTQEGEVSA